MSSNENLIFWFGLGGFFCFVLAWFPWSCDSNEKSWNLWNHDNCFNVEINRQQNSKIPSAQKLSINLLTIFPRYLFFSCLLLVLQIWSTKLDIVLSVSPVADEVNHSWECSWNFLKAWKNHLEWKITGRVLTKVNRKCEYYFCLSLTRYQRIH